MAPAFSKLTSKNIALAASSAAFLYWLSTLCVRPKKKVILNDVPLVSIHEKDEKKEKANVDIAFFRQILQILKILVPGVFTPEFGYGFLVAASLVLRTMCDIWMIHNGTVIESAIIGRNAESFKKNLKSFAYTMPLISFVNNMIKYGLNELKLRFRTRLSLHLYDQYLSGLTYYRMNNLDSRIANPDQLLTQDVEKFCNTITDVYSNVSKPLLDILLFVRMLTRSTGMQSLTIMVLYLVVAGTLLTRLRRPIGRMTVMEQKLEGELRFINSRIMMNSEEIAFYRGNIREKISIQRAFKRLTDHLRDLLHFRFSVDFVDTIVAKYIATVVGYLTLSLPFFGMKYERDSHSQRLETYYKNGRMLVKMAEAIGRLVLAGRDLTRLAGYTSRVSELMKVLKDIKQGHYVRTMINNQQLDNSKEGTELGAIPKKARLTPGAGKIAIKDKLIRFEKVPLVTPNGDLLVEDLTFEVKSGMNVLVCGPNGCGKSSLFRILGELWPLFGGTVIKPAQEKLFYIPQKPYMTLGTLRDQVIYPDSLTEMRMKGITDQDLEFFLEKVQLMYLLEREGGWDAVQDWMDVLSGGEKQRIAMSRLFYHKPQFAILDECTSAVSVDVEGSMYQYCRQVGISLFTVSHRKSLWRYHEYYLYMDGRGSFEFKPVSAATEEFGS